MSYTRGPWIVDKVSGGLEVVNEETLFTVATIRFGKEANARLIASAPDLFLALQKLCDAADDSNGAQYGTLSTSFVRDIAIAAIKKATS